MSPPAANTSAASKGRASFGASETTRASCAWKLSGATTGGTPSSHTPPASTRQKTEMRPGVSLRDILTFVRPSNTFFKVGLQSGRYKLMRMQRHSRGRLGQPTLVGWWVRALVALLFIFQTGYVRYHLLSEGHHDEFHAASGESAFQHDDHDDGDHDESDHHKPHAASDHLLQMAAKYQTWLLTLDFLPSDISFCLTQPASLIIPLRSRIWKLPGESPPDPAQPRAPPLV